MSRPFLKISIEKLEDDFEERKGNQEFLKTLAIELSHRKTDRAKKLDTKVKEALRLIQPAQKQPQQTTIQSSTVNKSSEAKPQSAAQHSIRVDLSKQNAPENVLSAWIALEVLSPQSFKRPQDLAGGDVKLVATFDRGLPWERGESARPNTKLFYQVILGTIDLEKATSKLLDLYTDSRVEKPNLKGEAVLAIVVVDKHGRLVEDPAAAISSFGWGVPQALKGDLSRLNQWSSVEKSLIEGLDEILRQKDQEGNEIPLNKTTLDQAYHHLVSRLDLPDDLVKKNQFAVRSYEFFKNPEPPEPLLLNSFFLGDLSSAIDLFSAKKATGNLKKYLGADKPKDRHNLLKDYIALEKSVAPSLIPPARWPGSGRYPLVLLQQAAVNLAMHELKNDGILAVNGPPGTGKTTLLRDIVAALVTERAEIMSSYNNPEEAFKNSGERLKAGPAWLHLYRLDDRLKGFEMLIASSNNKAVENVSAELPGIKAIAQDAVDLRYFSALSDKLLDRETWGVIAAVLGNAANRGKFRHIFWWDKEVGLSTYLAEASGTPQIIEEIDPETEKVIGERKPRIIQIENPPANHEEALARWQKARYDFQTILRQSRHELKILEELRQTVLKLKDFADKDQEARSDLEKSRSEKEEIDKQFEEAQKLFAEYNAALRKTDQRLSEHQNIKPHWFKVLLNIGNARSWRKQNAVLQSERTAVKRKQKNQEAEVKKLDTKHIRVNLSFHSKEKRLYSIQNDQKAFKEKISAARDSLGNRLIDEEFFTLPHSIKHQLSPWCDEKVHTLRDDVFIAAMKLHKAFIEAAAKPIRHNLGGLMQVFAGRSMPDAEKQALLPDLWSSLFLVVPSVSTTFASVERMLGSLPPESLGWLLIDEAGQALPQAAVGALMRTKKAVVVGDPIQIEPVVVLPETLTKAICKHFAVDADHYNAPDASVQTLADAATPYYAEFEGKHGSRAVGVPLLVHRRCADPMFSISNVIAYERLMVQAKKESASSIRDCLGTSGWIDVQGESHQDKWCLEEGEKVLDLLRQLKENSITPDLYIVTPFVIVSDNMRRLISDSGVLQDWVENPHRWVYERVGTVHTVQGREAEAVIFILGAPSASQNGARGWAGGRPNLLNVAVTRAKEALYVVGNRDLWRGSGLFSELHQRI